LGCFGKGIIPQKRRTRKKKIVFARRAIDCGAKKWYSEA